MAKMMNKNKIYRYTFTCSYGTHEDQSLGNILFVSEVGYENWKDALVGLVKAFGEAVKLWHYMGEYSGYRSFCCLETLKSDPGAVKCSREAGLYSCGASLEPVTSIEPEMATEVFVKFLRSGYQDIGGESWQVINDHGWRMAGSSYMNGRYMDISGFEDYLEVFFEKGEEGLREMLKDPNTECISEEYELKPVKKNGK